MEVEGNVDELGHCTGKCYSFNRRRNFSFAAPAENIGKLIKILETIGNWKIIEIFWNMQLYVNCERSTGLFGGFSEGDGSANSVPPSLGTPGNFIAF